jgi:hypothetical protein
VRNINETDDFFNPLECDAIISNRTHTPLMVMVADCTPILLYDTKHHAIGAVHAGRAGAFGNIIKNTLHAMYRQFGSKSEEMIAVLGPSICQNCYEVNQAINDEAEALGYGDAVLKSSHRYFLHVNCILQQQLLECGLKKENIEIIAHCTSCEHETFFSYRGDGGTTGRQAAVIMLHP